MRASGGASASAPERFRLIAGVYLLLMKQNKILLLRRFNTGYEDGKYTTIAGHMDGRESVVEAAAREAMEEAGISINPDDLEVVHVMHRRHNPDSKHYQEFILFFLTAKKWKGEPTLVEKDKSDDIGWFDMENLPDNIVPHVKEVILNSRKGITFSEFVDPYPY